jgi:hypothetical protein
MRKMALKQKHPSQSPYHPQPINLNINHIKESVTFLTNTIKKNTASTVKETSHKTVRIKCNNNRYVNKKFYRLHHSIKLKTKLYS